MLFPLEAAVSDVRCGLFALCVVKLTTAPFTREIFIAVAVDQPVYGARVALQEHSAPTNRFSVGCLETGPGLIRAQLRHLSSICRAEFSPTLTVNEW